MIDVSRFDFPNIFGVVRATDGMTRNQVRPLRAEIQEIAIAKYSGGQLNYCGDTEHGRDFVGTDGLFYESKALINMFEPIYRPMNLREKKLRKHAYFTRTITLKKFRGKNKGIPEKTFDYMFLWDTNTNSLGITDWNSCHKNFIENDASITFKVHQNDIDFVVQNVVPTKKEDIDKRFKQMITEIV